MKTLLQIVTFLVCMTFAPVSNAMSWIDSGAHDGFTRLVVYFPKHATWQHISHPDGFSVQFSEPLGDVDLSKAFQKIGKERVADIIATVDRITVTKACICGEQLFLFAPGILVIDVSPSNGEDRSQATSIHWQPQAQARLSFVKALKPILNASAKNNFISYSANQPLPKLSSPTVLQTPTPKRRTNACIPDSSFGLIALDDDFDFRERIVLLQTGLADGQSDAALAIATLYLSNGLGQEALPLLDGVDLQEAADLRGLANILDERHWQYPDWHSQIECPGQVALWSAVANGFADRLQAEALEAQLRQTVSNLPVRLQTLIAPRLLTAFQSAGAANAAEAMLPLINRQNLTSPEASELARLSLDGGTFEEIARAAHKAIELNNNLASDAYELLFGSMDLARQTSAGDRLGLKTWFKQANGSSLASQLRPARIRVAAAEEDQTAFLALIRSNPSNPVLFSEIVTFQSAMYEDIPFLKLAFALTSEDKANLNPQAIIAVENRFAALGFSSDQLWLTNGQGS